MDDTARRDRAPGAELEVRVRARFCNWMEARNYSPRTVPDYDRYVRDFLRWLARDAPAPSLPEVAPEHLRQYQLALGRPSQHRAGVPARALSVSSQISRLAAVKTFFSWLARTGQIAGNTAASIESPRLPRLLPREVLTRAEARLLLESTPTARPLDIRDRAIVEVLYATGVRRAELLSLTVGDADTRSALLRVERGKGGRSRVLPLTAGACAALALYLREARPPFAAPGVAALFVSSKSGGPLSDNDVVRIVRKAARRAGISKRTTPHTLRHSCATHLLQGRADIRLIQKLLGHRRLSTTEIYTRVEIGDLRRVVTRCHPRGKGNGHESTGYAIPV